jgi:hypothetical protein
MLVISILILVFLIPFGASFQSILYNTTAFSTEKVGQVTSRVLWPVFGEFGFLQEIKGMFNNYSLFAV